MRKHLIVGCGGSGAKTQSYMIDQLKALLAPHFPERTALPAAFQFVTVDVPINPERGPEGLDNVPQAGGKYVGVGKKLHYSNFDAGLSQTLAEKGALGEIATWAPTHPQNITTPVTDGAGQYRAIGRMLTLPAFAKLRNELEQALDQLNRSDTSAELDAMNERLSGKRSSSEGQAPVVFVISSMAGGAGASMMLDVCRILSSIGGISPANIGVFMYTPEAFENTAEDFKLGMWPNSLAMFGEAFASQVGSATASDEELCRAMGLDISGTANTFGRIFPLGSRMGTERAKFGDGSQKDVYRGVGRALTALMYSDQASDSFVQYSLANTASPETNRSYVGWGDPDKVRNDVLSWGSMGYAQLSMGRDKYAEYSAQRLAHAAFDRLLRGHLDPTNSKTGEEQLNNKLDERFPNILENDFAIPGSFYRSQPGPNDVGRWLLQRFNADVSQVAGEQANWLRGSFNDLQDGMKSQEFRLAIQNVVDNPAFAQQLHSRMNEHAYLLVHSYADELMNSLVATTERELANVGLPYTREMLSQFKMVIRQRILHAIDALVQARANQNPAAHPSNWDELMQPLSGNNKVKNGGQILDQLAQAYEEQFRNYYVVRIAAQLSPVLDDFLSTGLVPLNDELAAAHQDLEVKDKAHVASIKLADVTTDEPTLWPTDLDEKVDDRFRGSFNEILITDVEDFSPDYEAQLIETVKVAQPDTFDVKSATSNAARAVILGKWESQDAIVAPEDTLAPVLSEGTGPGNRGGWISKHLLKNPTGGESRESRRATFRAKIRPTELLDRSRMWINRKGYHFERFISVDLRTYMRKDESMSDFEFTQRVNRLQAAFQKSLGLARPLAAVDTLMVERIHNQSVKNRFTFSEIPFQEQSVAEVLAGTLSNLSSLDETTRDVFQESLTDGNKIQRIDVFGAYPNYSPIVYSSLLPQVGAQWKMQKGQPTFWNMRRARPISAAIPMTQDERRAMVGGWIIGMATGRIHISNEGSLGARAHIFDDGADEWVDFPPELLTPPNQFRAPIDWMPAVIESVLLAYAEAHVKDSRGNIAVSLRPYQLLRGLYDNAASGPTGGAMTHPASVRLADFLRDGKHLTVPNQILGTTQDERFEHVEKHLQTLLAQADNFVKGGGSALPGEQVAAKPWANPPERGYASNMPLYRDFAPDVMEMARDLHQRLTDAKKLASRPTGLNLPGSDSGPSFGGNSTQAPTFDFGGGAL